MRFVMEQIFTPEQAEKAGFISIGDAIKQKLTDRERTTLYRQATENILPSCRVKKGSREVLWILKSALSTNIQLNRESAYKTLLENWKAEMLAGTFAVRRKKLSQNYVNYLDYGFQLFWQKLKIEPSLSALNVSNLRKVLASFNDDEEKMNDQISCRTAVYKAYRRFTLYLLREGLRTKDDVEAITEEMPHSRYKPKRDWLEDFEIKSIIAFNKTWKKARTTEDIVGTNILIHLYGYAGLRLAEAIKFRIEDINLVKKILKVRGKGGKERYVIPLPEFWPDVMDWLESKDCPKQGLLIPSRTDRPLTKSSVYARFQSLYQAMKKDCKKRNSANNIKPLRPHDFRRAFAIMWANRGMPLPTLQLILGHDNISTTMSYIPINIEHGLKWVSDKFPEYNNPKQTDMVQTQKPSTAELLLSILNKEHSQF